MIDNLCRFKGLGTGTALCAGVILAAVLGWNSPQAADGLEDPPTFAPQSVLGADAKGPGWTVSDPIRSDGLLRIYQLETADGALTIDGDFFVRQRLKELKAIDTLETMKQSSTYQDSFQKALKGPVNFGEGLVQDPEQTVQNTVSGVGRLFGRAASGVRNIGKSDDSLADSLLGVSSAKREIAVDLGVDPYTQFAPLADRLEHAARTAAAGGLTVKGLFALVPGGVGLVASSASTASDLVGMIKDKTSAELRDINREKLTHAVGDSGAIELFLDSPYYTPTDQTVIAEALYILREAKGVEVYLTRTVNVSERSQAIFMRERAVMHARFHDRSGPIAAFAVYSGIPVAEVQSGGIVGLFPIDSLAWTKRVAGIVSLLNQAVEDAGSGGGRKFIITGTATKLAQSQVSEMGWDLTEGFQVTEQ